MNIDSDLMNNSSLWPDNPTTTAPAPTEQVQPIPELTIEDMPDKKWLRLQHPGVVKYITLAEAQAIHDFMADQCRSTDCLCWQRVADEHRG